MDCRTNYVVRIVIFFCTLTTLAIANTLPYFQSTSPFDSSKHRIEFVGEGYSRVGYIPSFSLSLDEADTKLESFPDSRNRNLKEPGKDKEHQPHTNESSSTISSKDYPRETYDNSTEEYDLIAKDDLETIKENSMNLSANDVSNSSHAYDDDGNGGTFPSVSRVFNSESIGNHITPLLNLPLSHLGIQNKTGFNLSKNFDPVTKPSSVFSNFTLHRSTEARIKGIGLGKLIPYLQRTRSIQQNEINPSKKLSSSSETNIETAKNKVYGPGILGKTTSNLEMFNLQNSLDSLDSANTTFEPSTFAEEHQPHKEKFMGNDGLIQSYWSETDSTQIPVIGSYHQLIHLTDATIKIDSIRTSALNRPSLGLMIYGTFDAGDEVKPKLTIPKPQLHYTSRLKQQVQHGFGDAYLYQSEYGVGEENR